jgi:hypothetical protein
LLLPSVPSAALPVGPFEDKEAAAISSSVGLQQWLSDHRVVKNRFGHNTSQKPQFPIFPKRKWKRPKPKTPMQAFESEQTKDSTQTGKEKIIFHINQTIAFQKAVLDNTSSTQQDCVSLFTMDKTKWGTLLLKLLKEFWRPKFGNSGKKNCQTKEVSGKGKFDGKNESNLILFLPNFV